MKLEHKLDSVHAAVTRIRSLQLFTAFTRILLGIGFIPPSIVKILHHPFTMLPDSNPVGHYFRALYETGFYYEFLGWGQLIAAVMLLFPRTAHIGALLFFPIILNIAVLTTAVGFKGTPFVVGAMLLAALYLVAWDYDRWKSVIFGKRNEKADGFRYEIIALPLFFALGGVGVSGLFYAVGVGNLHQRPGTLFGVLTALGFVFGFLVAVHHRYMSSGPLERSSESL